MSVYGLTEKHIYKLETKTPFVSMTFDILKGLMNYILEHKPSRWTHTAPNQSVETAK